MRPIRTSLFAAAVGLLAVGAAAGPAAAATVKADYGIWLGGLPLGSADLATTVDGPRYRMQLQVRLTGLAGLLTGGKGAATAAGSVGGPTPVPASFASTTQASSNQRTVRIGLAGGTVAAVEIEPPLEDRSERVPVRETHKRGVVDPVSGLLMPAIARGELTDPANCNRTIPVFDGGARFDVVLRYSETKTVEKPGYKGSVLVCSARYVAIAGHRADRPAVKFMEDNRDMSVWLAPVEGARLLLPMRIEVKTASGMSLIEASRWSAEAGAKVVPATTGATEAPPAAE